ncbi:MAG: ArgE/DapE family deacylase [bacterium]|nr:ArgE/DapE family deacylase [bacterium]
MTELEKAVLARITESDLVSLSRELVRRPSETGKEKEVSDFCVASMKELGMQAQGIEGQPARPNAVGVLKGVGGGPRVQFSGHLDTVPPGDLAKWITDPYGGEVIDGKIYGRGVMDSKGGGIASTLVAIRAIREAGVQLRGDINVVGTVDEEVGGRWGMRFLVENGHVNPDLCIYCVHSDMEIKAHFKGVLWTKLTVRGQTAHGSMPYKGVNAITRASRYVVNLEDKGVPYQSHPILNDFTMNFGWVHAGPDLRYNMVADLCELGIDMRLVPGQTTEAVYQHMKAILAEMKRSDAKLDADLAVIMRDEPVSVPDTDPVLTVVRTAARDVLGEDPAIGGTIAAGDLAPIFKRGLKGVGFGPGDLERGNAHKENEFLEIDQLLLASRVYALIMLRAGVVA